MSENLPFVSVIIPVFNRSWQLRRALDSLRSQTFQDFEVIVCDDGSTDNIPAVVKDFETILNIRLIQMPNWGGPAKPRNEGLKVAKGQWISYLDSDDWWDPERLTIATKFLDTNIDVFYHSLRVVRESSSRKSREMRDKIGDPISADPFKQMMLFGNPLPTSATIVRKASLEHVQGMAEERILIAVEDFDCWLRLARNGARFYFLDQCLGNYWVGIDAISTVSQKHIDSQKTLYLRHGSHAKTLLGARAFARQNYILGTLYFRLGDFKKALDCLFNASPLPSLQMLAKRYILIVYSLVGIIRNKFV